MSLSAIGGYSAFVTDRHKAATHEETMSNLGEYHHSEEPAGKTKRLVTWIMIAVILAGGAGYAIYTGMFSSNPAQTEKTYPRGL